MESSALTPTNLLASASKHLADAGYTQVSEERLDGLETLGARFFEDQYRVVMLLVLDTWPELHESWTRAQASLVELISTHMTKSIEKSWDGYLVLLTLDPCPPSTRGEVDAVRYDTFRVRKLVAAGDELRSLADVQRALLPLLPIEIETVAGEDRSALDMLPELLAEEGIEQRAAELLLEAFAERSSLTEALHRLEGER
jgi:hypothetical protein